MSAATASDSVVAEVVALFDLLGPAAVRDVLLIAAENFHETALDFPEGAERRALHATANALCRAANAILDATIA